VFLVTALMFAVGELGLATSRLRPMPRLVAVRCFGGVLVAVIARRELPARVA
jgi:hypothetical protein